ncbi:MAG TPA: hypothetical protein VIM73_05310, partial [Polyangiaceae bacterium]
MDVGRQSCRYAGEDRFGCVLTTEVVMENPSITRVNRRGAAFLCGLVLSLACSDDTGGPLAGAGAGAASGIPASAGAGMNVGGSALSPGGGGSLALA